MRTDYSLEIPDREYDEEGVTKKQRTFIYSLCETIELDKEILNIKELGIRQASALIDQLIELRDSKAHIVSIDEPFTEPPSFWLGFGIFLVPFIFSWVTLLPKYSKITKAISFSWLAIYVAAQFSNNT